MTSGAFSGCWLSAEAPLDESADEFFSSSQIPRAPLITASIFTAILC